MRVWTEAAGDRPYRKGCWTGWKRGLDCFPVGVVAGLCWLWVGLAWAQPRSGDAPPMPPVTSPVDFFRELLGMPPGDREVALSNRPPEVRSRLLAKVREYEALSPEERELRLRATELRWFLVPLMRQGPGQRPPLETSVPAHLRQAISDRLALWDRFLAPVREQFF